MKKLIESEVTERVLVVKHTTSKKCKDGEFSTVEDENGEFRPLRVKFSDRTCGNRCCYIVYKIQRMFYVSVYFYFIPFTTIILTCIIPILKQVS